MSVVEISINMFPMYLSVLSVCKFNTLDCEEKEMGLPLHDVSKKSLPCSSSSSPASSLTSPKKSTR